MQPQMQTQKQPAPPSGPPSRGKAHYYMCIADEHERRAAQAWLDEAFPNAEPRLVTELRLARLHEDYSVSVLVRKPKGSKKLSHSVPLVSDEHGIKEASPREADDLAKEIVECTPIDCSDHWIAGTADDREGELNVSRFLEELGKTCTPATIKWREDSGILRLGWA